MLQLQWLSSKSHKKCIQSICTLFVYIYQPIFTLDSFILDTLDVFSVLKHLKHCEITKAYSIMAKRDNVFIHICMGVRGCLDFPASGWGWLCLPPVPCFELSDSLIKGQYSGWEHGMGCGWVALLCWSGGLGRLALLFRWESFYLNLFFFKIPSSSFCQELA